MSLHTHDKPHDLAHRAEVNEYFEQIVKLLAQIYAYNHTCANVERSKMGDDQLQSVADTVTELFSTQADEPDTDCKWLSKKIVATMNGLSTTVQEILDEFGIIKASIERFEAMQHSDPQKYAQLLEMIGADWVLLHSHVELRKTDDSNGQTRSFFLHSPYLEPLEVFKDTSQFSKISDKHIANLRRGVYEVLGWQLASESSIGTLPKSD